MATYLVPFAAMSASTLRERGALVLFLALIAVLYVRANLFYVNPLLGVVGYRLFEVTTKSGTEAVLISSRRFLAPDQVCSVRRLSDYVYWEVARRD